MNSNYRRFYEYVDLAAEEETKRNVKKMLFYINEACKIPDLRDVHIWTADYMRAITYLLYGSEKESEEAVYDLLRLRQDTRASFLEFEMDDFLKINTLIEPFYVKLIAHLLWKKRRSIDTFKEFKELAEELITLTNRKELAFTDGKVNLRQFAFASLGQYYFVQGKAILSEKYLVMALENVNKEEIIDRNSFCTYKTLMEIYLVENNLENACDLGGFLCQKLIDGKVENPYQGDVQRLFSIYFLTLEIMGMKKTATVMLQNVIDSGFVRRSSKNDNILFVYFDYLYISEGKISWKMKRAMKRAINDFEKNHDMKQIGIGLKCELLQYKYFLAKATGNKNSRKYMDMCMELYLSYPLAEDHIISANGILFRAVREYLQLKDTFYIKKGACCLMENLQYFYSKTDYYLDNVTMEINMDYINQGFCLAYAVLAELIAPQEKFKYLLNYKSVLSSVIRTRNHNTQFASETRQLLNRMNQLKDRLTNVKLSETEESSTIKQELEDKIKELEYEFAQKYNFNTKIEMYSLEQLHAQIPSKTVIIDFFFFNKKMSETGQYTRTAPLEDLCLDILVFVKQKKSKVLHATIPYISSLSEDIMSFTEALTLGESKPVKAAKKLYEDMLQSFEEELLQADKLWISPHRDLCNIPFEILLSLVHEEYEQKEITYWQSLRDIFEGSSGKESCCDKKKTVTGCAIGAPLFYLDRSKQKNIEVSEESRVFREYIITLPYSKYETEQVASINGFECYVEESATKYRIRNGYDYIHIATHGLVQYENQNPWYESALAFSGVGDWMTTRLERTGFGNGMLTAEEISRMDLHTTQLVVLSACHSGVQGFTMYDQQAGLQIAFGTAGVKYIISALWEVEDFATTIFMCRFYECLHEGNRVLKSLNMAKCFLRNITVADIKERFLADPKFQDVAGLKLLEMMQVLPDDYRIYRSPYYWGGFICYQYKL